MKYTQPVYRPPYEANTLLLQVTVGCAHNKCTFCTMYRDVKFQVEKIDQVEKDLQEAQQLYGNVKRVFLVNGDAFVLSAKRLKEIHIINSVSFDAELPKGKQGAIDRVNHAISNTNEAILDSVPERHSI